MEKKYWLHRISHHQEVSYDLLEKGYLTIGWEMFSDNPQIISITQYENKADEFREFMDEHDIKSTSRWGLWRFGQMKKGDVVVVPMYGGEFGIFEVIEEIKPIGDIGLNYFITEAGEKYEIKEAKLVKSSDKNHNIDLGFFIKVKPITSTKKPIPRNFAKADLVKRMKIRQANADISDLKDSIERAIEAREPNDAYAIFVKEVKEKFIKENRFYDYTPDQMEEIVANYFRQMGADVVEIPPKNSNEKPEGGDIDVIADFQDLKTKYYVQVKHHQGETGEYGLDQVKNYIDDMKDRSLEDDDIIVIPWLLTTAKFSENVKESARLASVRLIDGNEFIEMIFNAGIDLLSLDSIQDN